MKLKHALACILLLTASQAGWAAQEDIIIIEMDGKDYPSSSSEPSVSVWKSSTRQLEKAFKNKTVSQVLTAATTVPSIQDTLTASSGEEYVLLRYADEDPFRKFLFYA